MWLKGVIFDLDGTLGHTIPVLCAAFRRAFARFLGRSFTADEIIALFGPTEEGIFRRLVPDQWRECARFYLRVYEEIHGRLAGPFPGIEDALKLLEDRGVSLAVATGKGPRSTAISLRDFNFAGYFAVVETGSADGPVKPRLIGSVVKKWSMPSGSVAYVGDTACDMGAAREAGVVPLGAAWAPTADAAGLDRAGALATFTTVAGFIAWLDGNSQDRSSGKANRGRGPRGMEARFPGRHPSGERRFR